MFNIEFLISFFPYVLPDQVDATQSQYSKEFQVSNAEEPAASGATFIGGIEIPGNSGAENDEDCVIVPKHGINNNKKKPSCNADDLHT